MAKEPRTDEADGRILIDGLDAESVSKTRKRLIDGIRIFIVGGDVHHNPSEFVAMVHSLRALDMLKADARVKIE